MEGKWYENSVGARLKSKLGKVKPSKSDKEKSRAKLKKALEKNPKGY